MLRAEIAHSVLQAEGERSICPMTSLIRRLWIEDDGRNIAEYAVMFAVIVAVVISTIRLLGSN